MVVESQTHAVGDERVAQRAHSGQPNRLDYGEGPRFKEHSSALRAFLDVDRAEGRRRAAIPARKRILRRTLAVADAISVGAVLVIGAMVFGADRLTLAAPIAVALLIVMMKVIGLYDRDEHLIRPTTLDEVPALFQVATLSALLLWLMGDQIVAGDLGRRPVLGMWLLLFLFLIIGRSLARAIAARISQPERCLVIGDAETAAVLRRKLNLDGSTSSEVVGWVSGTRAKEVTEGGSIPMLPPALFRILAEQQVHRVVVAPGKVDGDALMHYVRELSAMHVSVSILPATPPVPGSLVELDDIHGLSLLAAKSFDIGRSSRLLKRSFDVLASSLMLAVLSPVMAATALAIRLDSPGPILFRQRRVGSGGQEFEMMKFRSMFEGSEHLREELRVLNEADGLFKIEDDPRITGVGRRIRRWSIDELPQLFNVLRGEMGLVGPRPLVPDEDSQIEGFYRRRLDIPPGITGYWQSLGASRIPLFEMVRLDYLYVATWSLWHDVRILLRTVPYVVGGQGR